jgi:large subunit ribosomal protein L21
MNFAIIETGGKQYRVEKGRVLDIERLEVEAEGNVVFDKVLLVHDDKDTRIGTPFLEDVEVVGKVVEHKRGDKIVVFKMKAKKRYQKKQGHRQELTTVEIVEIKTGAKKASPKVEKVKKEEVEKPVATEKKTAKPAKKTSVAPKASKPKSPAKKAVAKGK